jgi:3-carboxy-cis,cis-muconate cycloisomerase
VGRAEAYKIVQAAVKQVTEQGKELRQAVLEDRQARQHLTEAEIEQALDPANYLGSANLFINRALAAYHRLNPAPDR